MDLILFLMRKSRTPIILATVFGIFSGAAGVYLIRTVHLALDQGAGDRLMWSFLAALVVIAIATIGGQIPLFKISEDALFQMRLDMVQKIVHTRLRSLELVGKPKLFAALTRDLNQISEGLVMLPMVMINGLMLLGGVLYLGILSWKVLWGMLVATLVLVALFKLTMRRATGYYRAARDTEDQLFDHFQAVTDGNKELKLHRGRANQFFEKLLLPAIGEYRENRIRGSIALSVTITLSNIIFFLIIGFLVFLFPRVFDVPPHVVSGTVLVFVFLMSPLGRLLDVMPTLSRAGVALKKVASLELEQEAPLTGHDGPERVLDGSDWREIELRGVTHAYYNEREDEHFSLGPIDLTLRPGELTFLIGGNGSGKSTLAKVVTGLYEPESGSILCDGQEVTDANRKHYRQMFSAIFSDFYLFEHFLGLDDPARLANADRYLHELHIAHKVQIEGGRLSTTQLSSGQRKRLALLVSYLEDRPVYLFDEWASDQDPIFKQTFYQEILPDLKRRGKSVLAITHDDRFFHLADRIIKLESGRLLTEPAALPTLTEQLI